VGVNIITGFSLPKKVEFRRFRCHRRCCVSRWAEEKKSISPIFADGFPSKGSKMYIMYRYIILHYRVRACVRVCGGSMSSGWWVVMLSGGG